MLWENVRSVMLEMYPLHFCCSRVSTGAMDNRWWLLSDTKSSGGRQNCIRRHRWQNDDERLRWSFSNTAVSPQAPQVHSDTCAHRAARACRSRPPVSSTISMGSALTRRSASCFEELNNGEKKHTLRNVLRGFFLLMMIQFKMICHFGKKKGFPVYH